VNESLDEKGLELLEVKVDAFVEVIGP